VQILFNKDFQSPAGTVKKQREIWIANFDGSNTRKIPVSIHSDVGFYDPQLSPNGKTVFFTGEVKSGQSYKTAIYSFSVDVTGFKKVLDFDSEYVDSNTRSQIYLSSVVSHLLCKVISYSEKF